MTAATGKSASSFTFASPDEALAAWIEQINIVDTETLAWQQAAGRILASPIIADRDSPACDASAMDGYAVRIQDVKPGKLNISGEAHIGQKPVSLTPGYAVKIVTGAPVPAAADAVIRREDVQEYPDNIIINENLDIKTDQNIRRQGENIRKGNTVIEAGLLLTAPSIAAASTFGAANITVYKKVKVAIIVTGNEVLSPDAEAKAWQLRDSNGPGLTTMLSQIPWLEVLPIERSGDTLASIQQIIDQSLANCDAVILTGGVSMGDYDFVPTAVKNSGCKTVFHKLPIRPGKPLLAAVSPNGKPILGLPGNPVSVLTTARRFGSVVLSKRAGLKNPSPAQPTATLENSGDKILNMWWSRPITLDSHGHAKLVTSRGSGDIVSAAQSHGFIEIPPNATGQGPWPIYRWEW